MSSNSKKETTMRLNEEQRLFVLSVKDRFELKNQKEAFDYIIQRFIEAEYESNVESKAMSFLQQIKLDTEIIKDYIGA